MVTNGVDLERYRPRPRDPALARRFGVEEQLVIGYLGTHGMAHALENVLDAAELLRDRPRVHFLFVGDGAAKAELQRGSGAPRPPRTSRSIRRNGRSSCRSSGASATSCSST